MSLMAIGTYASYFEVQVPLSAQTTMTTSVRPTGHFCTTVNTLDESGCSYAPSAERSYKPYRPRRVEDDSPEDDPYMGNHTPVGDTPYVFFALLIAGYVVYRRRFARDTND